MRNSNYKYYTWKVTKWDPYEQSGRVSRASSSRSAVRMHIKGRKLLTLPVREKVSSFKRHKDPNRTDPDETELTEALNGPIKHKALQLNLNSVIMKLSTTLALLLLNSPLASGEAGGIRSAVTSAESDTAGQNTDCHCSAGHCDQRACGQFASCGGKPAGLDLLSFIRFQLLTFTSLHPSVE